jgi:hypothetical protein
MEGDSTGNVPRYPGHKQATPSAEELAQHKVRPRSGGIALASS